MNLRIWAPAVLVALLACARPRWAAPVTVNLRVEGSSSTIFEGPVTTDGKVIDKGDGPHPCDGTNGGAEPGPGADDDRGARRRAGAGLGWGGTWYAGFQDFLDRRGSAPTPRTRGASFWGYALNYQSHERRRLPAAGAHGDEVLFASTRYTQAAAEARRARSATVAGGPRHGRPSRTATTGSRSPARRSRGCRAERAGRAGWLLTFDSPGIKTLKAERAGAIRSNALESASSAPAAARAAASSPTARCRRAAVTRLRRARSRASAARATGASTGAGRGC